MNKKQFFKAFLLVYVGFLIFHAISLQWDSWIVGISLLVGFGVALLAHTRYGILTIGLLVVHMALEWIEYAHHEWYFSKGEIFFHGIHVCLDFVFLYQELRVHARRYWRLSLIAITAGLVILFGMNYQPQPKNRFMQAIYAHAHKHSHNHRDAPIEPFVIGGMFGCILSHLVAKKRAV
jgi:hypothetical protein